jgi:hypothetical protein
VVCWVTTPSNGAAFRSCAIKGLLLPPAIPSLRRTQIPSAKSPLQPKILALNHIPILSSAIVDATAVKAHKA